LAQGQQIVGLNLLTRRSLGCFKENVQEDAFANQTSMGDYAIFPFQHPSANAACWESSPAQSNLVLKMC
jgi:hypothetical protein